MAAILDDSSSSRLGVNKASKISKLRRGGAGGGSGGHQRPPPTVYKTEPEGFRSLVQELTGPSSFMSSGGVQQRSSRIRNMAPPPLVSAPKPTPLPPPSSSMLLPSPKFPKFLESFPSSGAPAATSPKFVFPFSPSRFDFSPRDMSWAAALESPGTADMKTLAALVSGRDDPVSNSPKLDRTFSFDFSFS